MLLFYNSDILKIFSKNYKKTIPIDYNNKYILIKQELKENLLLFLVNFIIINYQPG